LASKSPERSHGLLRRAKVMKSRMSPPSMAMRPSMKVSARPSVGCRAI
jgi:hypothetical protein